MSNEPKHTATPWIYRPNRHDDWGFIRDSEGDLVAVANNTKISFSDYDGFRSRKEDPFEPNGKRIVQCVNEYDGLIETIESLRAENAELNALADKNDIEIEKLQSVQTDLVFENQVYRGKVEELESERSELIEALRATLPFLEIVNHHRIDWIRGTVRTTLAKYEKP